MPSYGMTTFPDRDTFAAIRRFQDDHGLRVDGVMEPGGPTERSLNSELNPWYAADDRAAAVMDPGGTMESPMGAGYDPGNAMGDRTAGMQIAQQDTPEQDLQKWKEQRKREVEEKIDDLKSEISKTRYLARFVSNVKLKKSILDGVLRLEEEVRRLEKELKEIDRAQTV